jgi:hypothetical protein
MMLAALVDTSALARVILYSLVTTLGLSIVFSFGIVGVTRYDECRRRGAGGYGWAALALLCGLLVAAVVVEAIVIMAKK